jgi:hypothetical protein
MPIPTIPAPAKPVDDAIIDTPWGAWVHDILAAFPVLQTMRFNATVAAGVLTRDVIFPEAYPAGWTVIAVGAVPAAVTNTSPVTINVNSVALDRASVRVVTTVNLAYNGGTGPHTLTVAGFPPGGITGPLWRYLVTPTLLEGAEPADPF